MFACLSEVNELLIITCTSGSPLLLRLYDVVKWIGMFPLIELLTLGILKSILTAKEINGYKKEDIHSGSNSVSLLSALKYRTISLLLLYFYCSVTHDTANTWQCACYSVAMWCRKMLMRQ